MADASASPGPDAQVRALFEQTESGTARAFEELVSKPSFGLLLAPQRGERRSAHTDRR